MIQIRRTIVAMALLTAVPACSHWQQVPLTGRNHPSGWADQIRGAAVEAYPYALMSNNAYHDRESFDLGPNFTVVHNDNDNLGFAYSVFDWREGAALREVVIAYRGTELGFRDIFYGSITAAQNARGLAIYDAVRARTPPEVPVNVTGHSLGGAIATQVSVQRPNVRSYIFNASPRFQRSGPIPDNRRLSIVERGELLKVLRIFGREAPQEYISLNCSPYFHPLRQHSIRLLAECLTRIASWEDPLAGAALKRNHIEWPARVPRPE